MGKLKALAALLVVLGGLGGWNYYRNLQAERAEQGPRPMASVDVEGLEALAEAYRSEIRALEKRHAAARHGNASAAGETGRSAFLGENLEHFEKVQRSSRQLRGLSGEIAAREAQLEEVEEELAYRARLENGGLGLHLQRLVGI